MARSYLGLLMVLCSPHVWAQAEFSGQLRAQWTAPTTNHQGPLRQAHALYAGSVAQPSAGLTLETELRARGHGLAGVLTLQQQWRADRPWPSSWDGQAWINELNFNHDGGAWQFSLGKKVVDWDVGYAFRPNDMVQHEQRQALVSSAATGRPLVMAEYFGANHAWSFVWVNPTQERGTRGAQEPAVAARYYQRVGGVDWHGFARLGEHTGASVGGAVAWVASDALELHGSLRWSQRVDSQAQSATLSGVVAHNPWQAQSLLDVNRVLVGGTWTSESHVSLLAEAWWDGTAPSDAQWNAWGARNQQLVGLAAQGAPVAALAGNLAWQAQAFEVSSSLRLANVFLRLSWQQGAWQPAVDWLYTPADQGQVLTASLTWQGDRLRVQGGARFFGGPATAVLAQLPARSTAYVQGVWTF